MKLKPCPFCGCAACLYNPKDEKGSFGWYVSCGEPNCFCELGYDLIWTDQDTGRFDSKKEAIEAWNKRTEVK